MHTSLFSMDDALTAFLEAGHPIQVCTRDNNNRTAFTRSWGCKVLEERHSIMLFLPRNINSPALQNIHDNGIFAVIMINVYTYETFQLKGRRARVLEDITPWLPVMEKFRQSQFELMDWLGLPSQGVDNMLGSDAGDYVPVHCPVEACFDQTPGANAGKQIEKDEKSAP